MEVGQDRNPNSGSSLNPNDNSNNDSNEIKGKGSKGKSCKGCLYYTSMHRSKSQQPTCVGFSRTLQQVPNYIVGESEAEASKEGRSLTDFKYGCVGYSVFLDKNGQTTDLQDKPAELPFCVGLEVLLDKRTVAAEQVPAHAHKNEDNHAFPQRRPYKAVHSAGDDYFSRFKRNAGLVASGVARNVSKVGNYIKETVDDILYPYRRRPK